MRPASGCHLVSPTRTSVGFLCQEAFIVALTHRLVTPIGMSCGRHSHAATSHLLSDPLCQKNLQCWNLRFRVKVFQIVDLDQDGLI